MDKLRQTLVGDFSSFRNVTMTSTDPYLGNGTDIDVNGSNVTDS